MAQRTKKVKSVGRFGARYGVKIRRRIKDIEMRQRSWHVCSACAAPRVKRVSTAIWACRKCGHKFAGGAYTPKTAGLRASERHLRDVAAGRHETTE